ncbi:MAG: aldehyde dehydrogenase family protein [Thermomicrobiales bacterium]|nr:aldehyde dehydrogenase family protein [Thermomicrobiales bacterium]
MTDFKNYINGAWKESASGETFTRHNPATGELVATYTKGTATDDVVLVEAANNAFDSWRRLQPAMARSSIVLVNS